MIFCVEDDNNIRELVVYTLETTGLKAQGFEEGSSMLKALETQTPQLILLDVMLPGEDGVEILKKLKNSQKTNNIPVIMVTAKGAEYEKVKALDAGADDYVTKPFGMMELMSRVKAVLRRSAPKEVKKTMEYGSIVMDLEQHEVKVAGKKVTLTLKEFELLSRLAKKPGTVVTRDTLLNDIWGYDFDGETRTIDVHIRSLRQKLGAAGEYVETVRGIGYKLGER